MPKAAGGEMTTIRAAPSRPQPPSRPIKRFDPPLDHRIMPAAPAKPPGGDPKIAADVKKSDSGGIDPRQQHY
jgi:hypothetical protein